MNWVPFVAVRHLLGAMKRVGSVSSCLIPTARPYTSLADIPSSTRWLFDNIFSNTAANQVARIFLPRSCRQKRKRDRISSVTGEYRSRLGISSLLVQVSTVCSFLQRVHETNGASDTTSTTLTFLFWELARHKEWQRSLREELQNRCDSSPTFQQVQDLPVLDAVINEALRLHPAAPASLPRETPAGGKELDGYFIPEKVCFDTCLLCTERLTARQTIASMQCYTTQRDPAFHPNPDSFKPERWIAQSEVTDELKELFEAFLNVTGRLTTLWNWSCWPNSRSGLGSVAKPSPLVQPTKRLTPGLGQPFAQLSRLQASSSKLRLYFSSRSPREAHHAFRACRSAKMTVLRTTSALRRGLQASTYASRQFSTSVRRDASWGFIGLGAMGTPSQDSSCASCADHV